MLSYIRCGGSFLLNITTTHKGIVVRASEAGGRDVKMKNVKCFQSQRKGDVKMKM